MKRKLATALVIAGCAATPAFAQQDKPKPPPRCDSAEAAQFDFWLGEWVVTSGPDGKQLAGHNHIVRSADGCRLHEQWRGASGFTGESLNAWDGIHKVWRQFWVGADGLVLQLEGGLRDGKMVMEGQMPGKDGGVQQQRITWTPNDDGSVTQHWQASDDDGKTWQDSFLGVYRHPADKPDKAPAGN